MVHGDEAIQMEMATEILMAILMATETPMEEVAQVVAVLVITDEMVAHMANEFVQSIIVVQLIPSLQSL